MESMFTIMRTTSSSSAMRGDGAPTTILPQEMITVAYCSATSSPRDSMATHGRRTTVVQADDVVRPRERHRLMGGAANEDGEEGPN